MKIDLFKVFMSPDVLEPINKVLMSGFIGQGPMVEKFEEILRNHFGTPYVNTLNSATSGLQLAVHLLNLQPNDEVLSTPMTCLASNTSILAEKVKIKWVDIDPTTGNIDLNDLTRKLSPTTKAIMLVHWGGYPCDLDKIKEIQLQCKNLYGFYPQVIEDCAHAYGSTYKNKLIGSHDNITVFSFQAIKTLTTIDGGCIITPDVAMHKRAKLLRWYGLDRTISSDYRCLHPDTLILTNEGNKKISDIVDNKLNIKVMTLDKDRQFVFKAIKDWHKNKLGNRRLIKIANTIVTDDHLILTKNGWIKAEEIKTELIATPKYSYESYPKEDLSIKCEDVYCLTMETGNFCTEEVVVHNCGQNITEYGYKFHMADVNATIGIYNYPHTNSLITKQRENATYYNNTLRNVELLETKQDRESSYWLYTIKVDHRYEFIKKMKENGIAASMVHERNDKHEAFKEFKVFLPGLDEFTSKMICIPVGWWIKTEEKEYIADCINKGW